MPVKQVFAVPIAPLVGGKKVIFAFEKGNPRIGGSAVLALGYKIGNRTIAIINVDGIAIGLLLGVGD